MTRKGKNIILQIPSLLSPLSVPKKVLGKLGANSKRPVSVEEAEILRNSRRRGMIRSVIDEESPIPKRDVIDNVIEFEKGPHYGHKERNSVNSALHQAHLPKLEGKYLETYGNSIKPTEKLYQLEEYVEEAPSPETVFPETEEAETAITYDDMFSILSNARRRGLIGVLDAEGETEFGDVLDTLDDADPETSRSSYYSSLRQNHIPYLEENGVIENPNSYGTLEQGENFDAVAELIPDEEINQLTDL